MVRWLRPIFAAILLLLAGQAAQAHLTPNSELVLDFAEDGIAIEAIIPEGDYYAASNVPADRNVAAARRWLTGQVNARSPDGRAWVARIERLEFVQIAGPPDLHAIIRLTPPPGASVRRLTLRWSAVVGQNPDHFALILVGNDHAGGVLRDDRRLIGAVRGDQQTLTIDRGAPSAFAAFGSAFRLGVKHIAEGTDHLLFLLSLLLPAPLIAAGRQWGAARTPRAALAKLAGTITAFTIGHSLTLLIAALRRWSLPVAPVEIAIALSILVAALHALRPLFAGREALVAATFGLIHGLAFATLIGDAGVGDSDRLVAILGFNLGIEAVQLAVAAVAMLPLMLIAQTPDYRWVRWGGGLFAAVAAIGWLVERAAGIANPVADAMPAIAAQAHWLVIALLALALVRRSLLPTRG